MATSPFEKTSWGWQLSQFQQQIGEWLELQFSRFRPILPKWPNMPIDGFWVKLFEVGGWILLSLFLVWLGWQLWRQFSPTLYALQASKARMRRDVQSSLTVSEWLQRSRSYLDEGNYPEACRCLYLAMLQRLHDTEVAPHQPSRTDGEYLQLVQQLPRSRDYQTLIATHEQLCFGHTEVLPETFDRCWQAYREIEGQ